MLRVFDADRQKNFKRNVRSGSRHRAEGSCIEACYLKVRIDACPGPVRPRLPEVSERPARHWRRGRPSLRARRQVLFTLLTSSLVRCINTLLNLGIQIAAFGKFETDGGDFVRQVR